MEEKTRCLPLPPGRNPLLLAEGEGTGRSETQEFREILFSKAFLVVPGPKYNRVSYEMRGEGAVKKVTFYEVMLPDRWAPLRDRTYPSLARYLRAKSINPQAPAGVIVSLFFEDYFYLVEAAEFMEAYREIEGIDVPAFQGRVRQWVAG
jgi:hypothetical protein